MEEYLSSLKSQALILNLGLFFFFKFIALKDQIKPKKEKRKNSKHSNLFMPTFMYFLFFQQILLTLAVMHGSHTLEGSMC